MNGPDTDHHNVIPWNRILSRPPPMMACKRRRRSSKMYYFVLFPSCIVSSYFTLFHFFFLPAHSVVRTMIRRGWWRKQTGRLPPNFPNTFAQCDRFLGPRSFHARHRWHCALQTYLLERFFSCLFSLRRVIDGSYKKNIIPNCQYYKWYIIYFPLL